MIQVGAYEAKTHLSRLLNQVSSGEEVVITNHHVPIAKLIPFSNRGQKSKKSAILAMKEFSQGRTLRNASISELIAEGRK
jgi:prevent-host-death family protein